jgi:hypothetical protein
MGYYVGKDYVDTSGSWVPSGGGAYGYIPSYNTAPANGSATGGAGNLTGTVPTNYNPAYGGTPSVPDPRTTMTEAIGADTAALPDLYKLASSINDYNYQQKLNQILKTDPNFQGQMDESFKNIEAAQQGKVPADVANQLQNYAASRGIGGGTSGSDFIDYSNLYNYGKTSLDQQQWSENALTGAMNRIPTTTPFDFTSMMLSPDALQSAKAAANIYASAPNPTAANTNALGAAVSGMGAGANAVSRPTASTVPSSGSVNPVGSTVTKPSSVQPVQPTTPPVNTTPGRGQLTDPYGRTYYVDNTGNVTDSTSGGPTMEQMDQSNPYKGIGDTYWAFPTGPSTESPSGNTFASDFNQQALDTLFGTKFDYGTGQYDPVSQQTPQTTFDNTYWPEGSPSPTNPYNLPGGGQIDQDYLNYINDYLYGGY